MSIPIILTVILAAAPSNSDTANAANCADSSLFKFQDCGDGLGDHCAAAAVFRLSQDKNMEARIKTARALATSEELRAGIEEALLGVPSSRAEEKLVIAVHVSVAGLLRKALYNDIRKETKRVLGAAIATLQKADIKAKICNAYPVNSPEQAAVSTTIGLVSSLTGEATPYYCADPPNSASTVETGLPIEPCTLPIQPVLETSGTVDLWIEHGCLGEHSYSERISAKTFRQALSVLRDFRNDPKESTVIVCQALRLSKLSQWMGEVVDPNGINGKEIKDFLEQVRLWADAISQARVSGSNVKAIVSLMLMPEQLLQYYSATDLKRYRCGEKYAQDVIEQLACRNCTQDASLLPVATSCSQ